MPRRAVPCGGGPEVFQRGAHARVRLRARDPAVIDRRCRSPSPKPGSRCWLATSPGCGRGSGRWRDWLVPEELERRVLEGVEQRMGGDRVGTAEALSGARMSRDASFRAMFSVLRIRCRARSDGRCRGGRARPTRSRTSNGTWYVYRSSNGGFQMQQFGVSTDKPVLGDFDGDGKTDYAFYRPGATALANSFWNVIQSSNGAFLSAQFGRGEDKPVPADYDGNGVTNFAVYRPSNFTCSAAGRCSHGTVPERPGRCAGPADSTAHRRLRVSVPGCPGHVDSGRVYKTSRLCPR